MAKFPRVPVLTSAQRENLIYFLCQSMTQVHKPEEAAKFLTDLLSPQEVEMIAKRLEIAKLLIEGLTYQEIKDSLKVGMGTIARVNTWLNLSGEGFKLVLKRTKLKRNTKQITEQALYDPYSWYNVKRRYTKYFLPQIIVEEILKKSDANQRANVISILQSMEVKTKVTKELNQQLLEKYGGVKNK